MSTLDEIKKLEQQKQELIKDAKREALKTIEDALKQLADLGFHYSLIEGETKTTAPRIRRSGVRDTVLAEIQKNPKGISRADLLTAMQADDDATKQSISNAVAALKKAGKITTDKGHYSVLSDTR